jgi:uncharacterized membrane protein YeaQ/YmgE (transglycosylase-associated protein family)
MGILGWIILGGIAGWIASMITGRDASMGIGANIIVGIVGAMLGGFIFNMIGGEDVTGFNLWSLFVAVIGSVVLLGLLSLFRRPSV